MVFKGVFFWLVWILDVGCRIDAPVNLPHTVNQELRHHPAELEGVSEEISALVRIIAHSGTIGFRTNNFDKDPAWNALCQ